MAPSGPSALALAERSAVDGALAPATEPQVAASPVNTPIKRESEFVRQNRRIFSKAEDERPSAVPGSAEWEQQKARDAKRERELQKFLNICNC